MTTVHATHERQNTCSQSTSTVQTPIKRGNFGLACGRFRPRPRRGRLHRHAWPGWCRLAGFRAFFDQPAGMVEDAVEAEFEIGFVRGPDAVPLAGHLSDQWRGVGIDGHGILDGARSTLRRLILLVQPLQYY